MKMREKKTSFFLLGSLVCFGRIVISRPLISSREFALNNDVNGIDKLISPTYAFTISNGILLFVNASFKA